MFFKNNLLAIFSLSFFLTFFNSTANAERYCRRGQYWHHDFSSICQGRVSNYCLTRLGFQLCEEEAEAETTDAEDESGTTTLADGDHPDGEYCKRGRYWHFANSPACRGRPIDQCRVNGRYGPCDELLGSGVVATVEPPVGQPDVTVPVPSVETEGYRQLRCNSPNTMSPLQCMICNCYHEARGEIAEGRLNVGLVVMTRARMNSYPNSVCGVIFDPFQFSWTRASSRNNILSRVGYERCERPAREALEFNGHFASHYHATRITPRWVSGCRGRQQVGNHYFYELCDNRSRANPTMEVAI